MERLTELLREAWAANDLEAFLSLLAPDVCWIGIPEPGRELAECKNRDEVREILDAYMQEGGRAEPEIIAEVGDRIVVDVRPIPPQEELELHHIYVVRDGVVVRMEDYPDRDSACRAAGL